MKKRLLSLGMAVMLLMSALAMAGCGKNEPEYKPTFMYFVSASDENYNDAMTVVGELQEEYGDRVTFDIHNIDETPEDKENFPVDGTTPTLIMLNINNDISAMEFMCVDKATLVNDIENALNGEN